ncbi:MAG: heavy metal translocating P-type ATPase [Desulfobacteraceae bacterium]|nr:heavy metal translocating P-type ATPase [Desulfobacteraceae bacterium]
MSGMDNGLKKYKIVHEIPQRLRIYCPRLFDPKFDQTYLDAFLSNIPGVERVRLNTKSASVVVRYNGDEKTRRAVLDLMGDLPDVIFQVDADKHHPTDALEVAGVSVAALLTAVLPKEIAAPVGVFLSAPRILDGVDTLVNDGVKVEVLDASALLFSLGIGDYFTASTVAALLSAGDFLEDLCDEKSSDLLKNLLQPQVEETWVERDGGEIRININDLLIGDRVVCGTGELVPIDGVVVDGDALVNQSSITGESLAVHMKSGDEILSGGIIEEGRLKIEAVHVGADTGMARISRFLEQSLKSKSQTQQRSEELADKLVPVTFALGMGIYLATKDLVRAASVLTVDYSCAIKLSTPIGAKIAMFTAARNGVLLKGAEALDTLARVDTVVFDKTGTLTTGALKVTDIVSFNGVTEDGLLSLAAGAEAHYTHPVANAVVKAARDKNLDIPTTGGVDFVVAHGVSAYIDDDNIIVGSRHFIEEDEGIDCSLCDKAAENLMEDGKSLLFVAKNCKLIGVIALRDEIRPETARVLKELKSQGIKKIVVLTGDHEITSRAVAQKLEDLDEIHWELKPEDKAAIVANLKEQGATLAFVGDGVNDAPAMMTAHTGVCMPDGADIAKDSAQIVLIDDDLECLTKARAIAVNYHKSIDNCFYSAVGINSTILFLATLGYLQPVISAVLHNFSTIGILGYAAVKNNREPVAPSM